MSFKREGNDSGLLSILQRRRINDLLAEDIPEDEAKLLSNGRFTCLVCNSNPIFDTVAMLSVHRKGKKHSASAEFQMRKKEELKKLIAKRRHEQFLNTGSASIVMADSQHTGILSSLPYDSRMRRNNRVKPGDRKPRVELHQSDTDINTNATSKPGNSDQHLSSTYQSTPWQQVCEKQTQGDIVKHKSQLKNIFRKRINDDASLRLHPYTPKYRTLSSKTQLSGKISLPASSSETSTKQLSHAVCVQGTYGNDPQSLNIEITGQPGRKDKESFNFNVCASTSHTNDTLKPSLGARLSPSSSQQSAMSSLLTCKKNLDSSLGFSQVSDAVSTTTEKNKALKYHHIQGSGWKRDWDGKWIKDEEAEFDSDEEPPDLP